MDPGATLGGTEVRACVAPPWRRNAVWAVPLLGAIVAAALRAPASAVMLAVTGCLLLVEAVLLVRRARIVVSADGVLVRSAVAEQRWRWDDIAAVDVDWSLVPGRFAPLTVTPRADGAPRRVGPADGVLRALRSAEPRHRRKLETALSRHGRAHGVDVQIRGARSAA